MKGAFKYQAGLVRDSGSRDPIQQIIHNFAGHYNDEQRFQRDNRAIRGVQSILGVDAIGKEVQFDS